MVDSALLEQVLLLDAAARLELIRAIEGSLPVEGIAPDVLNEIDRRLGQLASEPSAEAVSSDVLIRRLRSHHCV